MTIYGWDMSHYDAPSIGTALAEGVVFITHKAGGDANDAELDDWWSRVRGLPVDQVLLGAYWVLYPGRPAERADAFIARLDAVCPGWRDRPFILQVDCERWGNNPATVPNRAEIRAFCDRLVARMPKLLPIVYAPKWVYGDTLTGLGYPLWASSYVNGAGGFRALYPGDESVRWGAYSGQTPAVLQYSSSATIGGQTTCDANAYRGTLEELTALVAPGWSDDMPTAAEIAKAVWEYKLDIDVSDTGKDLQPAGGILRYADTRANRSDQLVRTLTTALASATTSDANRDTALAANLAALPGAIRAELGGDDGGPDAALVEAAVGRALARLRIVAADGTPS